MELLSLYVHIPFCRKKCNYCDFYSIRWRKSQEASFIAAVSKEIDVYIEKFPNIVVGSLYVGGGSPGILSPEGLDKLSSTLHKKLRILENAEKTIEFNPENVNDLYLEILKKYGFNRISLGCQSFSDDVLRFLGRRHMVVDIEDSLKLFKKWSFENVNLDLIFGFDQLESIVWKDTLKRATSYKPTHLSTYSLSLERRSKFHKKKIEVLSQDNDYEQYKIVQKILSENGYKHYEVSAFCKPGFECKHNLSYWRCNPFIGLGPAASSYFQSYWYQNPHNLSKYLINPIPTVLRTKRMKKSSKLKNLQNYLVANFRLLDGIYFNDIKERFGVDFISKFGVQLNLLEEKGFLNIFSEKIILTSKGLYFLDIVLIEFV